jgi:ParB-like chromosome segregation protein Spo0J
MNYEQIALKKIVQGSPDDEVYVFTFRPDLTELQTSIERSGLLLAPVLKETEVGRYRVVCGSSRIKVLRHLGCESVGAFVVADGECTDAECISRSILENRWHRGFNEVEKALLFTRLDDRFPHLVTDLADALGEDLKMPQGPRALAPYRFILSLAKPIRERLARDELSLGQALLLRGFPVDAHEVFCRVMTECGLTLQESRKAAQLTLDAAAREGREASDFLEEVVSRPVLDQATGLQQKAQRLFSALRNRRYPVIESWNARFASARSQISAKDKGIHVTHDPTFESTWIKVQIQATSAPEFRQRLETLSEATQQGKIEELFQAMSVESNDLS